jgi:paraquat-inducible protein B
MAKKANPALIGGFVVGSLVLAVVAVTIWGSSELFERKYQYICYFPGSVDGLSRGAPVKYRGVEIGVVRDIKVRFRQAPDDRRIPVMVEVWGKRLHDLGAREPSPALLEELVGRGFRARLASVSLVTGVMYVSFDELPGSPALFSELPGEGAIPEIPTLPTRLDELTQGLAGFVANLSSADIKGVSASVSDAMRGVQQLATSGDLQGALKELRPLLSSARELSNVLKVDAERSGEVIEDAHGAVGALTETLHSTNGVISPQAPLSVNLALALSDVDKAAVSVRELADFLRRNPHAVVAGTKTRGSGP